MIPYAQLRPGPGFQLRRALLYYAQRLVTPPRLRRGIARGLAAGIRLRQGRLPPGSDAVLAAVAALERDGLVALPAVFSPAALDGVLAFLGAQDVLDPAGRPVPVAALPPGTAMAAYPLETVLACPGLLDAVNAPAILRIAAAFLGCKPTLSSLGVRWSFPQADGPAQVQAFHRDPDDWRFLKLFVYLTAVDAESGPHVYVAGSNRTAATLRAQAHALAALERRYGAGQIRTVTGPPGTTFMADTHGIHQGLPPRRRPRLILQAQYSLLPNFALRYAPVAVASAGSLDGYVNRLLVRPAVTGPPGAAAAPPSRPATRA
jgi:hypothetical protein